MVGTPEVGGADRLWKWQRILCVWLRFSLCKNTSERHLQSEKAAREIKVQPKQRRVRELDQ